MKKNLLLLLTMLTSIATWAQNVNGDDKVNYNDVTELSNYILGKPSAYFDASKADVNGDSKVDVADVVALINIVIPNSQSLVVWKSDGTKDYFDISMMPETTFDGYSHSIKTINGETKVYDKEDVLRYSFSRKDKPTDPKPTANDNAREAFYVYQNDGHFNGFFYDEIEKMTFSAVDTLGKVHDGIVSQEIVTPDSTYRIMLSAIDSIGFVQPEIIFNPKFRNLDNLGVTQYLEVKSPEYMIFTFPEDFPYWDVYVPEEGDVIASFTKQVYDSEGFLAKVTAVNDLYYDNDGNRQFSVRLKKADNFGDVFYQFITTERLYADEEGNVHRNIAGYNEDGTPKKARTRGQDNIDVTLLAFNANIQREYNPKENVSVSLGANLSLKLGMRVSYNINWRRIYIKFEIPADFKLTPTVGVKASTGFEYVADGLPKFLKAIKFPFQCPFLQTLPIPEFVIRGGGEVAANVSFPSVGFGVQHNLVIDSDLPRMTDFWWSKSTSGSEADENTIDFGSAEVSFSGYLQAALKLSANVSTCDWFSDLLFCYIGLDLYVGPKISGSVKLSTDMFKDYDYNSASSTVPYKVLSSSGISITPLSCDLEAKGMLGFFFTDKEERTFLTTSLEFFQTELHIIPELKDFSAISEAGYPTGKINAFAKTSGRPLIPTQIGARIRSAHIFTWDEFPESQMAPIYAHDYHTFTKNDKETLITFDKLPPGFYDVQPVMKTLGVEYSGENETGTAGIYVWPRFFDRAYITVNGMTNRKTHEWGKKEDDTTYDKENEEDSDRNWMCDLEVDCDENGGEYTLTANISIPNEDNSGDTSDPEAYQTFHSTSLTTDKLTLKLKVVDGLLYVTEGQYEHSEQYSSTSTSHYVGHGTYWDGEQYRTYTSTTHKVSTSSGSNEEQFSFSDQMIPFKQDWAGDLHFILDEATFQGSSSSKRDDRSHESFTTTHPEGKNKTTTSESHSTEEGKFKEGQNPTINIVLNYQTP